MKRRNFLRLVAAGTVAGGSRPGWGSAAPAAVGLSARTTHLDVELEELSLSSYRAAVASGRWTAIGLTRAYLRRIEALDRQGPALRAVLEVNPDALALARALDAERKAKGPRGPLHGVPVLVKDNLDTHDRMGTTAGSLALVGAKPTQDCSVVEQLRRAGAVLLGKTNLSEWANFRSAHSSSGWSGRGGQTRNPYVLDRNPSGSSSGSGVAVAANLCMVAVGTETDGSILSPSAFNGIVGLKPTVGLVSRAGIIPIAHSQDTAGPMARTVTDAAVLLGAMTGADPRDAVTQQTARVAHQDYTKFLNTGSLQGARLGVARRFFGAHAEADGVIEQALATLKGLGATLVDPADLPTGGGLEESEFQVMLYEFKADLNAYLAALGPGAPVRSLADIIAFNERHRHEEMPYFQQETFLAAEAKGPLSEPAYREALAKNHRLSRAEGIDALMTAKRLDAIVAPTTGPAHVTDLVYGDRDTGGSTTPAAVAGYPSITVPSGFVQGLPIGLSFFGRAYSEPRLLGLAYAFEQATRVRRPPRFLPTAPPRA